MCGQKITPKKRKNHAVYCFLYWVVLVYKQEVKTMNEIALKNNKTTNELQITKVYMKNWLIRKPTLWSVQETKLFYSALTQIKKRDAAGWVCLRKADIISALNMDERNANKLRELFQKIMKKSFVQFDGPTEEEWEDGFLIRKVRSTKKDIYVQFEDSYIPLLDELSSHFTSFYLDNIAQMKSKHAIRLFTYLKSWYDSSKPHQRHEVGLNYLKSDVFELDPDDYVRKSGRDKGWFDLTQFKRRCVKKAIDEINNTDSQMRIASYSTYKNGSVTVFVFDYMLLNKDGSLRDDYGILDPRNEQ